MRINTTLHASRLRRWSGGCLFFIVCVILLLSEMPYWGKGFALMFMGCFVAYQRLLKSPSTHLVQLIQFDKEHWRWKVQEPHRNQKTNLHEGRLVSAQGWFFVMVLRFETNNKNQSIMQNWVIWRDQVDADHWRRLIVISRFWAEDTQRVID